MNDEAKEKDAMVRMILLGAPGAGKGTLAEDLENRYGWKQISTGDLIRSEISAQTPVGMEVKAIVEKGELVPDAVVLRLLEQRLQQDDIVKVKGYILDGYPRNRQQAEELTRLEVDRELVMALEVEADVVVRRLLSRLTCTQCGAIYNTLSAPPREEGKCDQCGGPVGQRTDDNEETIRRRLKVYREQTRPVIDYYREKGTLRLIDASRSAEKVFETAMVEIGEKP